MSGVARKSILVIQHCSLCAGDVIKCLPLLVDDGALGIDDPLKLVNEPVGGDVGGEEWETGGGKS